MIIRLLPLFLFAAMACLAQVSRSEIVIKDIFHTLPRIAVPDMRGSGDAQPHMGVFNGTLENDLQKSGYFSMISEMMYPKLTPQQPADLRPKPATELPAEQKGMWLGHWSETPAEATHMTIGYTAVQNGRLVLFGWLHDTTVADIQGAQLFGKVYFGDVTADGARKIAHEFAADIIKKMGGVPLTGSKIFFTSNRTGAKEIWSMDYDGANQTQLTRFGGLSNFAAVSADGSRLAFTGFPRGNASIVVMSLETGRYLPFYNQRASVNASPEFTPDGQKILFGSSASGLQQIYSSNLDGSGIKRLTFAPAVETEPKVNPKTGQEIIFTSGRSGPPQLYKMNMDGADIERLTPGEGEAVNAAWHPEGKIIAFSWTGGPDPGSRNIFVMDVATKKFVQLTSGAGRNENPSWAPDGRHLVFQSTRAGRTQIFSMLADGTEVTRLTQHGANEEPVWSRN